MNPPHTPEPLLPNFVTLPLSPDVRLEPIVAALRSLPTGRASDYAETRAAAEAPYIYCLDRVRSAGNRVDEVDAAGVPAILVSPPDARGTLVGVHGGSYVLCSARTHLERFSAVGFAARLQTLAVDYRLGPEHPWPTTVDDVVTVMEWASDNLDGPVALVGDSAGGGLALAAWDGMFHTSHTYVGALTGADEAIDAAAKFLTDHTAVRP